VDRPAVERRAHASASVRDVHPMPWQIRDRRGPSFGAHMARRRPLTHPATKGGIGPRGGSCTSSSSGSDRVSRIAGSGLGAHGRLQRAAGDALHKPVAGEATLGDQNRNEIPLRTSYVLTSVEEPPWWFHHFLQLPERRRYQREGREPIASWSWTDRSYAQCVYRRSRPLHWRMSTRERISTRADGSSCGC
jgi:hypothetical protein